MLQIYYLRFFDLKTYLSHLLNFSIQAPYYFLLFFFQLRLISPFLISWCRFCNTRRGAIAWHLATIAFGAWFCSASIRYTFILPVHGGGKYLLGGTYLLIYYLGILLANFNCFRCSRKSRIWILISSGALWVFWWRMLWAGKLPFDQMVVEYWGDGRNPPSIQGIFFGVITAFFLYALFTLAEELDFQWTNRIHSILAFLGRYTLYTFLYHRLVQDVMLGLSPVIRANIWILRICVFIPMLTFPALAVSGLRRVRAQVLVRCRSTDQ